MHKDLLSKLTWSIFPGCLSRSFISVRRSSYIRLYLEHVLYVHFGYNCLKSIDLMCCFLSTTVIEQTWYTNIVLYSTTGSCAPYINIRYVRYVLAFAQTQYCTNTLCAQATVHKHRRTPNTSYLKSLLPWLGDRWKRVSESIIRNIKQRTTMMMMMMMRISWCWLKWFRWICRVWSVPSSSSTSASFSGCLDLQFDIHTKSIHYTTLLRPMVICPPNMSFDSYLPILVYTIIKHGSRVRVQMTHAYYQCGTVRINL